MQWEETDPLSLLWADESGGIHRWVPKSGKIESDNTNAQAAHRISKIAFTPDAKSMTILSQVGCVLIAHLNPTKLSPRSFTKARTCSKIPLSRTTIITMPLSSALIAVVDPTGIRIWEGVHQDCPENAFSCLYQLKLDPQSRTTTLTFSRTGAYLTAGNTAADVHIWDAATGKPTHKILTGHTALRTNAAPLSKWNQANGSLRVRPLPP